MEQRTSAVGNAASQASLGAVRTVRRMRLTSTSAFRDRSCRDRGTDDPHIRSGAAGCADGSNPAGTTCDTDPIKTLDSVLPTYTNSGTINATQIAALRWTTSCDFNNSGTFNLNAAGGLTSTPRAASSTTAACLTARRRSASPSTIPAPSTTPAIFNDTSPTASTPTATR